MENTIPSNKPEKNKRYLVWLRQSGFDLSAAQDSINNRHYEWACYQSLQSVEKSLKSIIVHAGYWPPKTHKLGVLVSMANRSNKLFAEVKFSFRKVEAYTFVARYPFVIPGKDSTPHEMINKDDAESCLQLAKDIYQKIDNFLKHVGNPSDKLIALEDYYFTAEETDTRLKEIIEKLTSSTEMKLKKMILFGSFAREKTRPRSSTMDLLIIAETVLPFVERIHNLRELTKGGFPIIEPLVYTPSEFEVMRKEEGEGFLESAINEGRVVYEEASTLNTTL